MKSLRLIRLKYDLLPITRYLNLTRKSQNQAKSKAYLLPYLKLTFLHFKQHYTHFHTHFNPRIFQKTTNNFSQTIISNTPQISEDLERLSFKSNSETFTVFHFPMSPSKVRLKLVASVLISLS